MTLEPRYNFVSFSVEISVAMDRCDLELFKYIDRHIATGRSIHAPHLSSFFLFFAIVRGNSFIIWLDRVIVIVTIMVQWFNNGSVIVVQWLVDASSVAASGCHRWLALLGERVSKMCKSHLAST